MNNDTERQAEKLVEQMMEVLTSPEENQGLEYIINATFSSMRQMDPDLRRLTAQKLRTRLASPHPAAIQKAVHLLERMEHDQNAVGDEVLTVCSWCKKAEHHPDCALQSALSSLRSMQPTQDDEGLLKELSKHKGRIFIEHTDECDRANHALKPCSCGADDAWQKLTDRLGEGGEG